MSVRVGKPAPEFETQAFIGNGYRKVKLSDYRGKWVVLFFYPGDFTFVCPTELTAVAARYGELKALGAEVLGISTDSHHVHKAWQEAELSRMVEGGVPYPLLSDPGGRIGAAYGVYDEEAGVDLRGRFLIDPDGVLQSAEVLAPGVGRNVEELMRQLQAFRHNRETGEVMPCGWRPSKATLKSGEALVGKVWEVWKPEKAL